MFLLDSHSDGTHSLQGIHWLSFWRHPFTAEHPLTLILTAPIHCRASIDSHSDGTHSLQSIHWLSFWPHPFTAENPLTLILMAPIHCKASIDSHSDRIHSLQRIHWLSFWWHPFTAEHPLTLILTASIHCRASIDSHSDGTHSLQSIHWLSFWRHPFTAEHPLTLILTAPIHCRASIAEIFLQTWWRNNLIYTTSQKFLFLYFQHHYSSLQCHMIFRNHNNMLIYDQETWLLSMLNTVLITFFSGFWWVQRSVFIWNKKFCNIIHYTEPFKNLIQCN